MQVPGEMDFIQELDSPLEEDDDGFLKPAAPKAQPGGTTDRNHSHNGLSNSDR